MLYGNYAWMNITGLPYVLSADDNKIIVLGCTSFAYMLSDSVSIADDVLPLSDDPVHIYMKL